MLIDRPALLARLRAYRNTDQVKVLVGVRRCGKSTLLDMFRQELVSGGVELRNVFVKRLDGFDVPIGYSAEDLHSELQAVMDVSDSTLPFYVFLDEVQDVSGWELVVRRLQSRANTDVYITGSNAQLLSGELSTHLAGRFVEIPVYPLSFREFAGMDSHRDISPDTLFAEYMRYGGMPGLMTLGDTDERTKTDILAAIFESVIVRDVAQRYGIRDLSSLDKLSRYLMATSGNLFSTNSVVNTLRSAGVKTSYVTIDNQIRALEQACVIYAAEQEGIRGKELLHPQRKFYAVDNGLRNLTNNFTFSDRGAQLEGIIFMELLRRGYRVTIGRSGTGEIDFVAVSGTSREYIQVTLSMLEESTRERELRPLQGLTDAYPRTVLTLDRFSDGVTEEGIRIVNAVDWLLENDGATGE